MLEQLRIKNFALIEEIELEFASGFNVLTGETGAGKSIILGALNSILGERITTDSIRSGTDKATIEARFSVKNNYEAEKCLSDAGIPFENNEIIIRREISSDGKNRVFINNSSSTLNKLKELGDSLIDIHGQHEHQSLLQVEQHLKILDQFGKLEKDLSEYRTAYESIFSYIDEKKQLILNENEKNRMIELLQFTIKEIDDAKLTIGEENELGENIQKLSHAEKLFENIDSLYDVLYNSEDSMLGRISHGVTEFEKIVPFDPKLQEINTRLNGIKFEIQDISAFLRDYRQSSDLDPARLDSMIERQELLNKLKKKYGKTIEEVIAYRSKSASELALIMHNEEEIARLNKEIEKAQKQIYLTAMNLSGRRHVIAKILEDRINGEFVELAMKGARFEIRFGFVESPDGLIEENGKKYKITRNGVDVIEFLMSTNVGEEPKQLRKIISGGELSRVMLALKNTFAEADHIGTMVFDEIDTGISGETALVVGRKLKGIAASKQVICITHLPQIAAKSDRHFTVIKEIRGNRTLSFVKKLNDEDKLLEIARIMKGDNITEATIEHAKELIRS